MLARGGELHDVAAYETNKGAVYVFRVASCGDCVADGDVAAYGKNGIKGKYAEEG